MAPEYFDLRARTQHNLVTFLRLELDLGFTFAGLAKTELQMGNREHSERSRFFAIRAVATLRHFEDQVGDAGEKGAIMARCSELERAIAAF